MASLGLTHEELKAIEQTRQRLAQLSSSLNSLKHDAMMSNPLPNLSSLQASADILNHNVNAILDVFAANNDLFNRVAIHPSTNFPGRTQEGVIGLLMRKKAEPDVQDAMDKGREMLASLPVPRIVSFDSTATPEVAKEAALEEVWNTTRDACQARIADYVMHEESDMFTAEEREMGIANVRTGLQHAEYEYDDEEDEDDEDGEGDGIGGAPDFMVIDRPPPPPAPAVSTQEVEGASIETVMRIVAVGQLAR
ncbi:mediator of RNA polymerase II transcription complex subunit 8-domain-containing protein [Xylaria sp. CBS 124048]|nr:mediator of RNA polymerase II transcription complex subunit 8-domain-containing protein [Xylaria sp. CBS 124048]